VTKSRIAAALLRHGWKVVAMARDPAARVAKDDDPLNGVTWIKGDATQASFTPPGRRTAGMREVLSLSDLLIDEIEQSDVILIEAPMYN
jgi:FMN-dependent NADH-azoreductase